MDTDTLSKKWVDVGFADRTLHGGMGIVADERFVYHISILSPDSSTHLTVLDRETLQVVHVQCLAEIADGHSLALWGDELMVASTGTDEVIGYRLNGYEASGARLVWTPTGSRADTHHVNSLVVADGEVLCSAFGPKDGEAWWSATNGYVHNITRDAALVQGLRQPHTVAWHEAQLYFCNSALGTVNSESGVVAPLAGYSRGLAFAPDGRVYAGTSVGRPWSELIGRCAVVQFSPTGVRTEIGLSPLGAEIYDLLLV
jgi:Domain of unknown function (DUF4915)